MDRMLRRDMVSITYCVGSVPVTFRSYRTKADPQCWALVRCTTSHPQHAQLQELRDYRYVPRPLLSRMLWVHDKLLAAQRTRKRRLQVEG